MVADRPTRREPRGASKEADSLRTLGVLVQVARRTYATLKPVPTQGLSAPVAQGLQFILNHFTDETALRDMADAAGMSPFHFVRKFRKETSITPGAFRRRCRIVKAMELLVGTDLPISKIAQTVGYQDATAFSRAFRKTARTPPYLYRHSRPRLVALPAERREGTRDAVGRAV